ncbi:hypothetical protein Tco_0725979 [Tanacetum coccineum]|uniref:Uncharacterized protein n=1 Tax=Tanacetum coccineum TaxID=301880 RepID=A0ABQ4YGL7_9ASTR
MSSSTDPITILSDSNVEDAFSSTNTPDCIPASPDYFPALPGNSSPDPSDDLSKYLLASLAISPFHDESSIPLPQAVTFLNFRRNEQKLSTTSSSESLQKLGAKASFKQSDLADNNINNKPIQQGTGINEPSSSPWPASPFHNRMVF